MDLYLIIVIIMLALAVSGLVVGVANDAVNFLNSALGSKAAPRYVIMTVASVLRGREEVVMWNRRVDKSVVYKAVTIMVCAAALVLVASFIISFLLPQCAFLDIIFECTSAFATVGLSSGVTGEADTISKLILTLLMYLGRVGPVSFALSLVAGSSSRKEIMPEGKIVVG